MGCADHLVSVEVIAFLVVRRVHTGAAASIAFLTAAATVFWLVTTVIWKLP